MRFDRPEHYYHAALERIAQAKALYDRDDSHAPAMYVAGVAVECLMRAFKMRRGGEFDERHDLLRLFSESGMLSIDPAALRAVGLSEAESAVFAQRLRAEVSDVVRLWANDYRYATEARLRGHLKRIAPEPRVKGDLLKYQSLRLYNAAKRIVDLGVLLWRALGR